MIPNYKNEKFTRINMCTVSFILYNYYNEEKNLLKLKF